MEKYEIEVISFPDHWFESEIATLTGLEFEEIYAVTKDIVRWSGTQYVKIFRQLGFNTNIRFIKFDRNSTYPCMMRTKKPFDKSHWYGFVYYDNQIYLPHEGILTWAEWNAMYPNHKITSMLQVWI